jgi:hypothetical protein
MPLASGIGAARQAPMPVPPQRFSRRLGMLAGGLFCIIPSAISRLVVLRFSTGR